MSGFLGMVWMRVMVVPSVLNSLVSTTSRVVSVGCF